MAADNKCFKIINSSVLIEEIKKHPVLYDAKLGNGNPELKKHSWEEVAVALFEERWSKFSTSEREAVVREIQVKWKSLRDNFTRVLRKEKEEEQSGISPGKKRKYIYYDQLQFLLPFTFFRKQHSHIGKSEKETNGFNFASDDRKSSLRNIIYLDENKDSNESMQYNTDDNPLQTTSQTMQPLQFIQIQPAPSISTMPNMSTTQISDEEENSSATKRIASVLEEVVALQKEEKSDDPMGNKKFLLSLLPFMQKLPDDVNLEVRLQLMSVLQTYNSGGNSFF